MNVSEQNAVKKPRPKSAVYKPQPPATAAVEEPQQHPSPILPAVTSPAGDLAMAALPPPPTPIKGESVKALQVGALPPPPPPLASVPPSVRAGLPSFTPPPPPPP